MSYLNKCLHVLQVPKYNLAPNQISEQRGIASVTAIYLKRQ
jgi:hypothetical protein